jgi:hypothetical protein
MTRGNSVRVNERRVLGPLPLKKGRVQIVRESPDGKRLILATLGPRRISARLR